MTAACVGFVPVAPWSGYGWKQRAGGASVGLSVTDGGRCGQLVWQFEWVWAGQREAVARWWLGEMKEMKEMQSQIQGQVLTRFSHCWSRQDRSPMAARGEAIPGVLQQQLVGAATDTELSSFVESWKREDQKR